LDKEKARKIVLNAVQITEPTWYNWYVSWEDIDEVFLGRAFDIGGFDNWIFIDFLNKYELNIAKIGKILDKTKFEKKYNRSVAGNLKTPFYKHLKNGTYGIEGKKFYKCVIDFDGNPGGLFWMLLWRMLICCNYLKNNYQGSFANYLKRQYAEYKNVQKISESDFIDIQIDEWEEFKNKKQPWNELYGIGPNIFDYIMGDVIELEFVKNSYKLDAANIRFLTTTGICKSDELNQNIAIKILKKLELPYDLREINKGLYVYCSKLHCGTYCFCRDPKKCQECAVNEICEQNF
jgi:hypothetical protein